jgi:hypothetical protein
MPDQAVAERDPRIDPQIGDQVDDRMVAFRLKDSLTGRPLVCWTSRDFPNWRSCFLTVWQKWARNKNVLKLGDKRDIDRQHPEVYDKRSLQELRVQDRRILDT